MEENKEIKQVTPEKKKTIIESNTSLFIFLILELLFFLAFGLFKIDSVFRIFGVILAVFCIPVLEPIFLNPKTQKISITAVGLLLVYGILTAVSPMINFGDALSTISLLFAFVAFFLLGAAMGRLKDFKIIYAILAFGAGLALVLFISLLATFYAYRIFHVALYRGQVIYIAGQSYLVSTQMKWLSGFEVRARSLNVPVFYITLLLSMLLPLILHFRKEDWPKKYAKWGMVAIVAVGLFGFLSLPLFKVLIYLLPSLIVIALITIFPKENRKLKMVGYVLMGLFAFGVFICILYAFNVGFIVALLDKIPLVNKALAHPYLATWLKTVRESVVNPFGSDDYLLIQSYRPYVYTTQNYLLDTLRHSGIVPFLALAAFTIFAGYKVILYVRSDRDSPLIRTIITSFLVAYFTLVAFNYPYHQLTEISAETRMMDFFPFARSELWLIVLFLLGYVFFPVKEEEKLEENTEKKNKTSVNKKKKSKAVTPLIRIPTDKGESV